MITFHLAVVNGLYTVADGYIQYTEKNRIGAKDVLKLKIRGNGHETHSGRQVGG